jgi:general stress protein 26
MPTTLDQLSGPELEKIQNFLKDHPVAVLATADAEGNPHASTVYISVEDGLRITFTTKHETNKYRNIAHNSHVVVVVHEAESQTAVQISGRAIEVTDPEAQQQIYKGTLHAAKQTGEDVVPPIAKIPAGPYVGFTIAIDDIQLLEYGWGNTFANALKHASDSQTGGDPL